jgi:ribosome-binding protein aMBF1 (putative translation factor)
VNGKFLKGERKVLKMSFRNEIEPVVWTKHHKSNNGGGDGRHEIVQRPQDPSGVGAAMRKLDSDGEPPPTLAKVSVEMVKEVQAARTAKGWSQKQLAQNLGIDVAIIRDLETVSKIAPKGGNQTLAIIAKRTGVKIESRFAKFKASTPVQ